MNKLYNLARMTTATTGTGTITLGSAVSGYLTFALAGVADGDVVSYGIKDGSNSEVGTGTYTASGTTLARTSITKSTNSNAAISLSGTAEVYITVRAEDFIYTDTERRNALLNLIYQSKLYAGFRRVLSTAADGFKASDGINAGSSSNYTLDTTGGDVSPSALNVAVVNSAISSIGSSVTTKTMTFDATGANFLVVYVLQGANTSGITATYNSVSMTSAGTPSQAGAYASTAAFYLANPTTGTNTVSVSWTGAANVYLVAVAYSGAAGTISGYQTATSTSTATSSTTVTTGAVGDLVVSASVNRLAATPTFTGTIDSAQGTTLGTGVGHTAGAASVTSTWTIGTADVMTSLSFAIKSSGKNNMIVVTNSHTADASSSTARVLLEIDNTATPTLNTDLTAEVSCNGGTNWSTATLSSIGLGQSSRQVLETADTSCTAGTAIQARIKTFNGKNIPIYGMSIAWH